MEDKLLIGRRFPKTRSKSRFLSNGFKIAIFHISGKQPVYKDKFTIVVIKGSNTSKLSLNREAGIGSKIQDPLTEETTRFRIFHI